MIKSKNVVKFLLPLAALGLVIHTCAAPWGRYPRATVAQTPVTIDDATPRLPPAKAKDLRLPDSPIKVSVSSNLAGNRGSNTHSAQLVRFTNTTAKSNFIHQNGLTSQELTHISELDAYEVRANKVEQVQGAQLYDNHTYRASLTPTDPQYTNQWYLPKIGAPASWNNTVGTSGVTVAIIDTGFGLAHQDLQNTWVHNDGEQGATASEGATPNCTSRSLALDKSCNNIDDDNNGHIDDFLGWSFIYDTNNVQAGQTDPTNVSAMHGTLVSGLAAAEANNSLGVSGLAWGAKVLPVQALSDGGEGDTVSVALGIRYAVDRGVDVINLSLGASSPDLLLQEQIDYALDNGVVVVAAAGNDGCNCLNYPANYSNVIAVGASTSNDVRAGFSSYGANLALVAPGTSSICSTAWSEAQPTNLYSCVYSGTSFSSPIVASSAALLLMQNPNLTPAQVKSALISTATKVPGMAGQNFTTTYGYGRLNVYEALKSVSLPTPRGNCTSYATGAQCEIRAVNIFTNQVVSFGVTSFSDAASHFDSSIPAGLPSGAWIVQMRVLLDGQSSLIEDRAPIVKP